MVDMTNKKNHLEKNSSGAAFKEGVDFYYNDQGLMVLTEAYHLKRGFCCHSDCLHCPYGEEDKGDCEIPLELRMGESQSSLSEEEQYLEYLDLDPDTLD